MPIRFSTTVHSAGRRSFRTPSSGSVPVHEAGFTLLELVLATFISSLVVGIMAVALNLSLRVWERQQFRPHNYMPQIVDLLKWQLAMFNSTPITIGDDTKPLFQGTDHSLTLATAHSVKALSGGVPVVARYIYLPRQGKLVYAEIPMNPHNPDLIREFLNLKPDPPPSWPRFVSIDVAQFSLAYRAEDTEELATSWDSEGTLPHAVLVRYSLQENQEPFYNLITPNFFFPPKEEKDAMEGDFDKSRKSLKGRSQL